MSDSVARRGSRPGDLRVVVRRPAKLPRTLGPGALFAACYGNVGSSIYYALGVTAAFALGLTPVALILAGFIFVTTALNYAEGTAALPHAGGPVAQPRQGDQSPTLGRSNLQHVQAIGRREESKTLKTAHDLRNQLSVSGSWASAQSKVHLLGCHISLLNHNPDHQRMIPFASAMGLAVFPPEP